MKYTIEVTAEDIATGERGHCSRCALALALKRETGFDWEVTEDYAESQSGLFKLVFEGEHAWLTNFVRYFDGGHPVKPVSFNIEL